MWRKNRGQEAVWWQMTWKYIITLSLHRALSISQIFTRHEIKTINCPRGRLWTHFQMGKWALRCLTTIMAVKMVSSRTRLEAGGAGYNCIHMAAQNTSVGGPEYCWSTSAAMLHLALWHTQLMEVSISI